MKAKIDIVPVMTTFLLTTALFTVWPSSAYGQNTPDATQDTMSAKRNAKMPPDSKSFQTTSKHTSACASQRKVRSQR